MKLHILGICGTFMGGVAALARERGHVVEGSDQSVYPPMSTQLEQLGIALRQGYRPENISADCDEIVIGNALSRGNPAVEYVLDRGLHYTSGAAWLREYVLPGRDTLAVAGTHGKTTTTTILSFLLDRAGRDPGFLIGGVAEDFGVSARLGSGREFVVEADEYDTAFFDKRSKFIQYLPHVLAINNCEFDHADIFRDLEDVLRTFSHVIRLVPPDGAIVANGDDANVAGLVARVTFCPVVRVGTGPSNDCVIADFSEDASGASFRLLWKGREWGRVRWALPGLFNARNAATAAVGAGLLLHPEDPTRLSLAPLATFQGVRRRQQVLVDRPDLVVIEDFGHHPTAIALTLESLRARHPGRALVAAFEPRSNTAARKVLQDGFREALAKADSVHLAAPHRADKLGAEGFDSAGVAADLRARGLRATASESPEALLAALRAEIPALGRPACVVFFSNGAFGGIIGKFAAGG